ncbi:L10-interacting MYB domain-containing protein-like [Prosopis cineraria]|uniref:L10-interacting MYB domain-containing protein-like n=1 Tax=Prosopis cineraria TaxID=364024 RepID=UPI00240F6C87|nr:L10-interacting MYB domain-containing protein-like [Prosopis cineraria]
MSKEKALWTTEETELFIKLALQQVRKNERKGSTLSKKGREALMQQFNGLSSRSYDKKQLKNKWDNLRKDWNIWDKLLNKETGLGWDSEKNTVSAPEEWWNQKIKRGKSSQNKKEKCLATVMVDSVSQLVSTQEDRVSTVKSILNSIEGGTKPVDQNVLDVAKELYGIEEIACDEALLRQCIVALLDKTVRDMYIGHRDNGRVLVTF